MSASDKKKAKPTKKKASAKKASVTKTKKVVKAAPAAKEKKAAPRAKKPAEKKEAPPKEVVKVERVELGTPPLATVEVRHVDSDSLHERVARGFSFGELASAGIPLNSAKREGLDLDIRRRSVVEGNVEALKAWFKNPGQVAVVAATKKK